MLYTKSYYLGLLGVFATSKSFVNAYHSLTHGNHLESMLDLLVSRCLPSLDVKDLGVRETKNG